MAKKIVNCLIISPFIDSETGKPAAVGSPLEVSEARFQRLLAAKVVEEIETPEPPKLDDQKPENPNEETANSENASDSDVKNDTTAAKNSKKGATAKTDGAANADDTDKG